MDHKLLKTAIVVSETLHFGLAADRLGIAQPHVSRRIKQIEDDVGVILFDRHNRNVQITEAGRIFIAEARTLLKSFDLARRRTRDASAGKTGKLYASAVMLGTVTTIMGEFHRLHPDVSVSIIENVKSTESHLDVLRDGQVDIIFSHPPRYVEDTVGSMRLVQDPLMAVLPAAHRLARRDSIALSELAEDPWVMIGRNDDPRIYDRIIALCRRAGFSPNIRQEASPVLVRLGLVAAGFGVHLLRSGWSAAQYPGVVFVPVEPTVPMEIFCYWEKGNRSPPLRNLLEIAKRFIV